MVLFPALLPKNLIPFLLTALLLQCLTLFLFYHKSADQERIQYTTTIKQASAAPVLSTNVNIQEFGLMAKKLAVLADLAEHYGANPSIESASFTQTVSEQFRWWNASSLPYIPWKRESWHINPFSDFAHSHSKTGIVICVGDKNAREAAHLITTLRNVHKSKLPIDIAYAGEKDLTFKVRQFLSKLGDDINFMDLTTVYEDSLIHLSGWATKPFALLASRHPQTILLSADAIFFSNPDEIFEDYPSLRSTGALFFHDRSITMKNTTARYDWLDAQLKAAGREPSARLKSESLFYKRYIGEEADAAVVCVDKSIPKMYMAMVFACWMNIQEVRNAVTWKMWWGEKESYWLAAELMGVPYSFEPWSSSRAAQLKAGGITTSLDGGRSMTNTTTSDGDHQGTKDLDKDAKDKDSKDTKKGRKSHKKTGKTATATATATKSKEIQEKTSTAEGRGQAQETDKTAAYKEGLRDRSGKRSTEDEDKDEEEDDAVDEVEDGEEQEEDTPLEDRRCTTHIVHANAEGTEPLWANGGMWLDKKITGVGMLNWTHWYLGARIQTALNEGQETDDRHRQERIMATQPQWWNSDWSLDAKKCPQHDADKWKKLSNDFRGTLSQMHEEVKSVEEMYRSDVSEYYLTAGAKHKDTGKGKAHGKTKEPEKVKEKEPEKEEKSTNKLSNVGST